ncbi:MAG: deoxyguanosinetriphosphate triphosphohydrolase [Clostridiaceae bacterium]|nr:deoxyguanosinetriphosphate triphosphohydrolase [Eubacteriales bacterium]
MVDDSFRRHVEELERQTLSRYATLSVNSRGREHELPPCPVRTVFVRDRDRVVHCKSFRRLKHKTQVFLSPAGDHYRTRLTHTLEVSQIARTIARGLRLNEDLTEAIALGHDLGHTPFGHAGESVLNKLVPGGFEHNVQSLRQVEKLENGTGLNLTFEVRDGIVSHKKDGNPCTLEGAVVSLADRIAYINHDIDDAVRAGVLDENDLPESCVAVLGDTHGNRINTMILDVLGVSFDKPYVRMSEAVKREFDVLRDFMFERVYLNPVAKREEGKGMHVIEQLYLYYKNHMELLPGEFAKNIAEDGEERVAADYIACMTDRYAIEEFKRLFVPMEWQ